jgi:hypothetical protein
MIPGGWSPLTDGGYWRTEAVKPVLSRHPYLRPVGSNRYRRLWGGDEDYFIYSGRASPPAPLKTDVQIPITAPNRIVTNIPPAALVRAANEWVLRVVRP